MIEKTVRSFLLFYTMTQCCVHGCGNPSCWYSCYKHIKQTFYCTQKLILMAVTTSAASWTPVVRCPFTLRRNYTPRNTDAVWRWALWSCIHWGGELGSCGNCISESPSGSDVKSIEQMLPVSWPCKRLVWLLKWALSRKSLPHGEHWYGIPVMDMVVPVIDNIW